MSVVTVWPLSLTLTDWGVLNSVRDGASHTMQDELRNQLV